MRRPISILALATVGVGIALALPGTAAARCDAYFLGLCRGSAFCVRVDTVASSGTPDDPFDELLEGDVPVSLTQSAADSTTAVAMATTTATADTGTLAIDSASSVSGASGSLGSTASTLPFALIRIDDLVFSGPTATVETSLMLDIAGSLSASASRGNDHTQATAQAKVELNGNVCGELGEAIYSFFGERTLNARHVNDDPAPVTDEIPSTGILADIPLVGTATLVTDPFTVPTGEPLQLELWMTHSTVALLSRGGGPGDDPVGAVSGVADFGDMLTFPSSGPVFDLPPGYTVNSVVGGIANNQVPEPGASTLSIGALFTLALLARRPTRDGA